MKYEEARELFLKLHNVPEVPSELKMKFEGFENLRKRVIEECSEVLSLVKSDFDRLPSSIYVYNSYQSCVAKDIINDVLMHAYDKEQHSHYKNILEYIEDETDMTVFRESQWMKYRQTLMPKKRIAKVIRNLCSDRYGSCSDEVIQEYDPQWQYSEHGSYGVYKRYKDKHEFRILMEIINRNTDINSALEEFKMLLLLKELDVQLCKTSEMMALVGLTGCSSEKSSVSNKSYKLDYSLIQDIHDFCECNDLHVDYDDFEESVRTANFKRIHDDSNKKNCWKSMLKHISNAVKGGHKDQEDWYERAVASIGISKSESRKGVGNLPVDFDEKLERIVSKRKKSNRT